MSVTTPSPSPAPSASASQLAAGEAKRKRNGPKFYAVKVGYQPGVYNEWNHCLAQVKGYKGAVCKSSGSIAISFFDQCFHDGFPNSGLS